MQVMYALKYILVLCAVESVREERKLEDELKAKETHEIKVHTILHHHQLYSMLPVTLLL